MQPLDLVRRLERAQVAVIGDLVADEYVYGETERVSREAPVLIVRHEKSETKPGGAANAAANVASLGATVRPVGVVGKDPSGRALVKQLEKLGADCRGVVALASRQTETKTRILAGGRSTTRQQMLRVDRADERPLTAPQRSKVRDALRQACEGAGALLVSDYGSGLFDEPLIREIRALSKTLPVCVDSRYDIRSFGGVTLAKPNEPELEAAVGGRLKNADDVERAGRTLLAALEVEALVVTRGRMGMTLFQRDSATVSIPVHGPDEAVDVTGAGDTVLATLTSALAVGASYEDAARLANVAAGIVVMKPGTATVSREELTAALRGEAVGELVAPRARAARRGRA